MILPLFYCAEIQGDELMLSEETSRHIAQVLRMKVGERLQLTDGNGLLADATITNNHKKKCTVKIVDRSIKPRPQKKITIGISLLKNTSRFEWFLEKATEVGIAEVVPLLCERTEKQHFRFDRMDGILISAMLQSRQVFKPVLQQPIRFADCIQQAMQPHKLIAHCLPAEDKMHLKDFKTEEPVVLLIGPEGDFTHTEIDSAKNFIPVGLGENRLRTETAGVVAAVLLYV